MGDIKEGEFDKNHDTHILVFPKVDDLPTIYLVVGNRHITFLMDSGATHSVINQESWGKSKPKMSG